MKPTIVPPSEVAKEIAAAVVTLAADVHLMGTPEQRTRSAADRLHELMAMFTLAESTALIQLIVEPRVRCARCSAVRPMRNCSGIHCLQCATAMRRADEARAVREREEADAR